MSDEGISFPSDGSPQQNSPTHDYNGESSNDKVSFFLFKYFGKLPPFLRIVLENITKIFFQHRTEEIVDLNADSAIVVDISDALSEREKVGSLFLEINLFKKNYLF